MRARVLAAVLLASILGCGDPEPAPRPEGDDARRTRLEKRLADAGNKDPWAFYELGEIDERQGELDRAVEDYGAAVALLPPYRATRPALALGRVHLARGKLEPARRMLEEVIATIASDPRSYHENPDYREASLLLKKIYEHDKDARAAARLRERFLEEFGGKIEDWPN
ncbi:hypothetical protein HY251_10255 [bacterium]|nr:hypothetical protein [bacterium]